MKSVLVVFNPLAGMKWQRHARKLRALTSALAHAGIRTQTATTAGPASEPARLFDAVEDFETVIACGGDGTVNEVVQAIMSGPRDPSLAVVPFGSGNLLARELGTRRHIPAILKMLVESDLQPCSVGVIERLEEPGHRRYWLAAAGIGADARVICDLSSAAKHRFGISAYYAEALRQLLFSRRPLPFFKVEFLDDATRSTRSEAVAQAVAERIGYFGTFLESQGAAPLDSDLLRVVLFKTSRRTSFIGYGIRLLAHQAAGHRSTPTDIEVVRTRELRCYLWNDQASAEKILAEADGELIGSIPVRISIAPRRIRLIRPS